MAFLGVLFIVAGLILYFALVGNNKSKRRGTARDTGLSEEETIFNEHKEWLSSRWSEAKRQLESGDLKFFPSWYFHEVTERQSRFLTDKGISLSGQLSKGQASDIIGLFFPVEDDDKKFLKFFNVPTKGLNQTTARAEVAKLQADPEKAAAWKRRPVEPIQKEFYRFFGIKVPAGLTHADAEDFIDKHEQTLASQQRDEWDSYRSILDELSDKEACEDYGIKKPSLAAVRTAIDELRQSGVSLGELQGDLDIVVQKLIELKPELESLD